MDDEEEGSEGSPPTKTIGSGWRFAEPRRNVALTVQDPPYVDTILSLDVENQVRMTLQRPRAQAGNTEFVTVPRQPGGRMPRDVFVGCL